MYRLLVLVVAISNVSTIEYDTDCNMLLDHYVELHSDLCLSCPYLSWLNIHWMFTSSITRTQYEIMKSDVFTNTTLVPSKYEKGIQPYMLIIHDITVSDIGSYQCATIPRYDSNNSPHIYVSVIEQKTVIIPESISCSIPVPVRRIVWATAPIGTPSDDIHIWDIVVRSDKVIDKYIDVISIKGTDIIFDSPYNINASFTCWAYDNDTNAIYGLTTYDVYWHDNACAYNPHVCLHHGSCSSTDVTALACRCAPFYAGLTCHDISILDICLFVILDSCVYILFNLGMFRCMPYKYTKLMYILMAISAGMYAITIIIMILHLAL